MKRLTYLLIFVASLGYSQSNLVFNRVLNFKLTSSQTATVPAGKVWKVENITNQGGTGPDNFYLDTSDADYGSPSITNGFIDTTEGGVVWLKEGSDISGYASNGTLFSILEFDVVSVSTTSTGSGGLSSEGLEFNQVINFSGVGVLTNNNRLEVLTSLVVPENKVWKITSVAMHKSSNGQLSDVGGLAAQLGTQIIYSRFISGYSPPTITYPIWISSGTFDLKISIPGGDTIPYRISISAIEYNIPQ